MNIKLKGGLRTEKLTLNVLLAVGIIAFFISLAIEIPLQKWMCYSSYHKLHLDYTSNVMLGVAASSVISYISLHFSFINKKNDQINSVLLVLREIYKDYKHLYNLVYCKATGNEKEEKYYLEKSILEKVNKLEETISDASTMYGNSEFSSENIGHIIKILQHEVALNLSYITAFCEVLLLDLIYSPKVKEQSSKYQASFWPDALINGDIEGGDVPRDVITKRAENECYQFLLETINSNYSIVQVDTLFKSLGIEFGFGDIAATINKLLDDSRVVFSMRSQIATQIHIRNAILQIRNKHTEEYFSERLEMRNRMDAAIKKMNETLKNDSCFLSKYEQFRELLREDRLKEAEEILFEIENVIPSD